MENLNLTPVTVRGPRGSGAHLPRRGGLDVACEWQETFWGDDCAKLLGIKYITMSIRRDRRCTRSWLEMFRRRLINYIQPCLVPQYIIL